MDPLSVLASVTGLVMFVSSTYKYGSGVKGACKAQDDLRNELTALFTVLTGMTATIANDDASSPEHPRIFTQLQLSLEACQRDIQELQEKLEKMSSAGKIKTAVNRLKWPLAEDDTTKIVQKLSRYRGLFHNALAVDAS